MYSRVTLLEIDTLRVDIDDDDALFRAQVCGNHSHRDVVLFEPARKVIKPVATSRDESEVPSVSR